MIRLMNHRFRGWQHNGKDEFSGGDVVKFVNTVSEDTVWIYHGTQIIPAGTFEKKAGVRAFYSNILDRTEIIGFEPQRRRIDRA